MMKNKKGVSAILVVILIVLIAFVAAMIVWFFVRGFTQVSGEKTEAQIELQTIGFSVQSNSLIDMNRTVEFYLKRDVGAGSISSIIISLEDTTGNVNSYVFNESLNELEAKKISIDYNLSNLGTIARILVTPRTIVNNKEYSSNTQIVYTTEAGKNFVSNSGGSAGGGGSGVSGNNSSPQKQKTFCEDSDGTGSINEQSKVQGNVVYIIDNCANELNENCLYTIAAVDTCLNSTTLAEQLCENNLLRVSEINCNNGCSAGICN